MSFPVWIRVGPWEWHPHLLFEVLAYTVGVQVYLGLRHRHGDAIAGITRWSIIAAAAVGGAVGSRILYWLEEPGRLLQYWNDPQFLLGGKTIVGGLIGGVIAVEWTKRWLGVRSRTGDLFAVPLAVGIAVGRVGCFLTGLADRTYGDPTSLWTGMDFGDGIPRHPTQLYEIAFLLMLAAILTRLRRRFMRTGDEFRLFMVGYLTCRLLVDAVKPDPPLAFGMSSVQWACAAMLSYYLRDAVRWIREWRTRTVAGSSMTTA